jgi:hypothetical protein
VCQVCQVLCISSIVMQETLLPIVRRNATLLTHLTQFLSIGSWWRSFPPFSPGPLQHAFSPGETFVGAFFSTCRCDRGGDPTSFALADLSCRGTGQPSRAGTDDPATKHLCLRRVS